ncbi:hypothetical protein GCM10011346_09470 [Oceanobacillus neutriphilus]|uniref:Uncharacterized protein n=1 Tax=Oceanobacillus neutriphilus TaxID=531815 RepID=A0ABQ2NSA1_9BACI|nr:hypothetical protein GCM10011346_09470 [Oceanobacillus neutriphilus]
MNDMCYTTNNLIVRASNTGFMSKLHNLYHRLELLSEQPK